MEPGTEIEGEWCRKEGALYLFDMTFQSVSATKALSLAAAIQKKVAKREAVFAGHPARGRDVREFEVEVIDHISYHYPPDPCEVSRAYIFNLAPDDWMLQVKKDGDRVLALKQPTEKIKALDLRSLTYQFRFDVLRTLVAKWKNPAVRVIPYTRVNFPQFYYEWKEKGAEGVVAKNLNAHYLAGLQKRAITQSWAKRRFSWD